MAFIRAQRHAPGYDPNLHHCIHGLDADLIMLALATHAPNFALLREEVKFGFQVKAAMTLLPQAVANVYSHVFS